MTRTSPPTPEKNAHVYSSRLITLVSFGIAVVLLLAAPVNPWFNLVLKLIGGAAAFTCFLSLFLRPVDTDQAYYHRVYGRFRNRFVKLHGSDVGGLRPLAIWLTIESKAHMIASTFTLNGDEISDLRDRSQLPVNFKGTLKIKVNPEKADFEYQLELSKLSTRGEVTAQLRETAIATARKVLRGLLYQGEEESKLHLYVNIEDPLFNAFDQNTYGLVIDRKQSSLDKVYNKEIEAEIVRAHAARLGFDRLMEGDFSLANFARVRAAYNGSTRFRETNITREPRERDEAVSRRRSRTPAAAPQADARATSQNAAVSPQADARATSQNAAAQPVIAETAQAQPQSQPQPAETQREAPAPQSDAEISNEEKRLRESIERLQRRSDSD